MSRGPASPRWRLRFSFNKRTKSAPAPTTAGTTQDDIVPHLVGLSSSVRSSAGLEPSEVSYDSERSLDDALIKPGSPPLLRNSTTDNRVAAALWTAAAKVWRQLRMFTQSISPHDSPVFCSIAVGVVLPITWILYGMIFGLFLVFSSVVAKWVAFVLQDPDVVKFKQGFSRSLKTLEKEIELTVRGNYSRQLVASYVFYVSTAPGESCIGAFLRQTSQTINMRVVEDINAARDRFSRAQDKFRGYRQAAKTYAPF